MKINSIIDIVGETPHLRMEKMFPGREVWIKLEKNNPGGSIKDRIALAMIEDAESRGILKPGNVIVEPTSGNTGIGLAMIGAVKGYRVILVMPESMSVERRNILQAYGAEIELTNRALGMKGSIAKAEELLESIDGAWMPSQFENPANPAAHEFTTAKEILRDFPEGFDYLISGVGTGGHISGVSKVMKKAFPKMRVVAVEPMESQVIKGEAPNPHSIMGIGAGFIPKNMDVSMIDETIAIEKNEAYQFCRRAAREEGLLVGISTGASLAAVAKKLENLPDDAKILTFNYDTGERYLSVNDLF